jgi:DNA-binding transcriptional regulator LsrR (DeoR family)
VPRTSEIILSARVARGYYLQGKSKSELADELNISRFRVARLLEAARRDGTVRIEIHTPGVVNADLSAQLQDHFGLKHAIVLDLSDDDPAALRTRLGESAAELLSDIATADDVIGLAWARSLRGIGNLTLPLPACAAVQLTGALTGPDGSDVL